jgi:tyrosyl-tRNA synthetase
MDAEKTSPYAFYQFWLNTADADVYKFMKYFTFLGVDEINEIELSDESSKTKPEAQGILASEVTELLHGVEGRKAAMRISEALFSGEVGSLTADDMAQLELDGLPYTEIRGDKVDIVEALVQTELAKSNKMAREFLGNHAVQVNGQIVNSTDFKLSESNALQGKYFLLRRGKKLFHLVKNIQ